MVEPSESLCSFHYEHEVDIEAVAFRLAFGEFLVLAVLDRCYEVCARNTVFACPDVRQVGVLQPCEHRVPCLRSFVVADIHVGDVHAFVGRRLGESVAPCAALHPLSCLFRQFPVGVGVGVDTFLLFCRAVSGVAREGRGEEEGCHYGCCDDRVSGVHSCCMFQVGIIGCTAVRQTGGGVQDGGR